MTYLTSVAIATNEGASATLDSPSFSISGSNKVLYVIVQNSAASPVTPSSVVLDAAGVNIALTKVDEQGVFATNAYSSLWRKIAPPDVSSKVVTVTWGSSQDERAVGVWVETDLDQTTPNEAISRATNVANVVNTVATSAITTSVGQRVIEFGAYLDTGSSGITFDSPNGTERFEGDMTPNTYDAVAGQDITASGSSTTLQWTLSGSPSSCTWVAYSFALNAFAGGGGSTNSLAWIKA